MKSMRVLIVDDLPEVCEGLATLLKLASINTGPRIEVIGAAQNECEAIQQARALQPDVILMDLEMPGQNGNTIIQQIKAEQPAIRVIVLSIHAGSEAQERAQAAGADAFFTKGDGYGGLLKAIHGEKINQIDEL